MTENIVNIKGNKYKYTYVDGDTKYLGPVGSAPALSEAEFLNALTKTKPRSWKKRHEDKWDRTVERAKVNEFLSRQNDYEILDATWRTFDGFEPAKVSPKYTYHKILRNKNTGAYLNIDVGELEYYLQYWPGPGVYPEEDHLAMIHWYSEDFIQERTKKPIEMEIIDRKDVMKLISGKSVKTNTKIIG